MQLIPALTPVMLGKPTIEPRHLAPYVEVLDTMLGQQREVVFAAPPQHGKTEVTKHALLKWMALSRDGRFYYVTFSQTRSDHVALDFWNLAQASGLKPAGRRDYWRSDATGSRVMFTSIGGPFTGEPLPDNGVCVIDDPIKDRQDGLSRAKKETAWGWLFGSMLSRRHPGSSVVCMATRWALDDPSGRLVDEWGFEYINLQAICEDAENDPLGRAIGAPLWPEQRPIEFLEERRQRDPWGFAAMYQGRPTPRGAEVFKQNPPRFTELPRGPFSKSYGIDLAYTAKTSADRSVCLRLRRYGEKIYVVAGWEKRVDAPSFCLTLVSVQAEDPAVMVWHIGPGGEKGTAQFIKRKVPRLIAKPATADKLVRATPVAEQWNLGNVLLPDEESTYYGEWVDLLIDEATSFTGVNDPHDDFVDALSSGFAGLTMSAGGSGAAAQNDHGFSAV